VTNRVTNQKKETTLNHLRIGSGNSPDTRPLLLKIKNQKKTISFIGQPGTRNRKEKACFPKGKSRSVPVTQYPATAGPK